MPRWVEEQLTLRTSLRPVSFSARMSRRWDRRRQAGPGPAARPASQPDLPTGTPENLQRLLEQASAHLEERNPELAFPLLRELLGNRALVGRVRGEVAALLGWTLLGHYPDDPVPREAREALAVATACAPVGGCTPSLQAYICVHDGEPAAALRCAAVGLDRLPDQAWAVRAQLLCIQAAAHHDLGHDVESSRLRENAIELWPECDLLPWLERRTTA
jgi:hypothetical protein